MTTLTMLETTTRWMVGADLKIPGEEIIRLAQTGPVMAEEDDNLDLERGVEETITTIRTRR